MSNSKLPQVGDRVGFIDGPGVFAEDNPGTCIEIKSDQWGSYAVIQMDKPDTAFGATYKVHGMRMSKGCGCHFLEAE